MGNLLKVKYKWKMDVCICARTKKMDVGRHKNLAINTAIQSTPVLTNTSGFTVFPISLCS